MARFDPAHLKQVAGGTIFARGEAYADAGVVTLVTGDATSVIGLIRGSETYRARLEGSGRRFSGQCSCPAYDRDGFCKHLVALALTANAVGDALPDQLGAIRAHLLTLGAQALTEMLLGLAERDTDLLRRLALGARGAAQAPADHAAWLGQELRAALALPHRRGWDDDPPDLEPAMELIEQIPALIVAGSATEARAMIETALDDLALLLDDMSDEEGEGVAALERLAVLHLDACRAAAPDPVTLAEALFELEADDAFEVFHDAAKRYADCLGEAGLAAYRALAEAAHASLPPLDRNGEDSRSDDRRRLTDILDGFAERDGDLELRIRLRRVGLVHPHDHLAFARFCREQGRPLLAREAAEEGAWLFDDHRATPLILLLAELLTSEGRQAEAIAALWRGLEQAPGMSLVHALLARKAPDVIARTLSLVRAVSKGRSGIGAALELDVLMAGGRLDEAWSVAREQAAPDHLLRSLAEASEATLPNEAIRAYREMAERQIQIVTKGGYEGACRLLMRLAPLEAPEAHHAFVRELMVRHRAKKSLLPMLERHLVWYASRQ